jgi:hypothetical protein
MATAICPAARAFSLMGRQCLLFSNGAFGMTLVIIFLIGAASYLLAVAISTGAYYCGQPKGARLAALPGPFGALMMIAAVLSAINQMGLIKKFPEGGEALLGFLSFVTILAIGIPLPWLLGWALAHLIRLAVPPTQSRRRRKKASRGARFADE